MTSNFFIQILGVIFSGFTVKLLTLPELGLYNLAKSLSASFQYTHLGLRYSLDRLLPEGSEESNLKGLYITLITNTIVSVGLFLFYIFSYNYSVFFLCYILGGCFFATFSLIRVYNRGIGKLDYFVYLTFVSNVAIIIIPFIGLYLKGENGMFLGYLLVSLALLIRYFPKKFFLGISKQVYKNNFLALFKLGFPIFVSNIAIFVGDNIDKFIINYFLGLDKVGEFGIISLVFSLILMLPSLIVELVFTDYIKQKDSKKDVRKIMFKHILIGLLLIFVAITLVYFALPDILFFFFPHYFYLIPQIKIIVLAIIPYIFISPAYCLLFAHDQSTQVSVVNILGLILYFLVIYFLLLNKFTMEYVLYSKIGYVSFYCIGLIILSWRSGLIKKYFLEI